MKKISLLFGIAIILLSFYYAFSDVSIIDLQKAFMSLHYVYLIPTVFLILLSYILKATRWRYLIKAVKEIKTADLLSPLIIGFMGNMLPARAGEFIRAYLLAKRENISFSTSFATIVADRLFDLTMLLLLLFGVLFFNTDVFSQGSTGENHKLLSYFFTFGWISLVVCLLILIFSFFLQYKNELAMKIVNACTRPLPEKWREKIMSIVVSFTGGFNIIRDQRGFFVATSLSFLILATVVLFNYPLYLAFDIDNSLPVISSLATVCLIVNVFVALFPTPGFLGAFQAAYVIALHEIYGIPKAVAASFGIMAWLCSMGIIVVAGAFFVIKDNVSFGDIRTKEQAE